MPEGCKYLLAEAKFRKKEKPLLSLTADITEIGVSTNPPPPPPPNSIKQVCYITGLLDITVWFPLTP